MKKRIQKIGKATAIALNKEERDIYNLKVGDVVDVEIEKTNIGEQNDFK